MEDLLFNPSGTHLGFEEGVLGYMGSPDDWGCKESDAWKWKVKVKLLSHVWLFVTPWTAAHQALLPMGFSRQEYWSELPLPSPKESDTIKQMSMRPGDT